jgi:hypothetical protein
MKDYRPTARLSILVFIVSIAGLALLRWVVGPLLDTNDPPNQPSVLSIVLSLVAFTMILAAVASIFSLIASLLPKTTK